MIRLRFTIFITSPPSTLYKTYNFPEVLEFTFRTPNFDFPQLFWGRFSCGPIAKWIHALSHWPWCGCSQKSFVWDLVADLFSPIFFSYHLTAPTTTQESIINLHARFSKENSSKIIHYMLYIYEAVWGHLRLFKVTWGHFMSFEAVVVLGKLIVFEVILCLWILESHMIVY